VPIIERDGPRVFTQRTAHLAEGYRDVRFTAESGHFLGGH